MNEATFTTKFTKWLKAHWDVGLSAAFEIKVIDQSKRKSFSLNTWKKRQGHQLKALEMAGRKLVYKLPDEGISKKPFDVILMAQCPAYLVLYFYKRGKKRFYMIEVSNVLELLDKNKTSIDENDCLSMAGVKIGIL